MCCFLLAEKNRWNLRTPTAPAANNHQSWKHFHPFPLPDVVKSFAKGFSWKLGEYTFSRTFPMSNSTDRNFLSSCVQGLNLHLFVASFSPHHALLILFNFHRLLLVSIAAYQDKSVVIKWTFKFQYISIIVLVRLTTWSFRLCSHKISFSCSKFDAVLLLISNLLFVRRNMCSPSLSWNNPPEGSMEQIAI